LNLTGPTKKATGTSITENLSNGTFPYQVTGSLAYFPKVANGSVTVEGSPVQVNVTFFEVYPLEFNETGLPVAAQSKWHVFIDQFEKSSLAGQPIIYYEPNGSYQIASGSTVPWIPVPQEANIVVNGPFPPFNFTFFPPPERFNVTFNETGLPINTDWQVTVDGIGLPAVLAPQTVTIAERNGSHTYSSGATRGYVATPAAATFTVNGYNMTIIVHFATPPDYRVSFEPAGLPVGSWSVSINGTTVVGLSAGATIGFDLPNGSYSYTIPPQGTFHPTPSSGSLLVAGSPIAVSVYFTSLVFTVAFVEFGLPSGGWWVVVNGTNYSTTAGNGPTIELADGTYAYSVGVNVAGYFVSTPRGSVYVDGQGVTISVSILSQSDQAVTPIGNSPATSGLHDYLPYIGVGGALVVLFLAVLLWRRYRRPAGASTSPERSAGR
ncbi:MAG: hypothetical protein L3K17_08865, partial [Thermoplasmata archaeon]|nr:hypothetical protein [Thermoplasmata archaeon]